MANTRQAKKRILVNSRKRLRNQVIRSSAKTALKKAKLSITNEGDSAKSKDLVQAAIKTIDKAACKGIVHKNTAARKKSRLMKFLHKSQTVAAV